MHPEATPRRPAFRLAAGDVIAARYRLEEEIARGGMGAVWRADDPKLRRAVAIKILTADWSASDDSRRRFEREAMAVAQLQCPQVVQIFDYGVERDTPFIVMELLQGEDLQKRIKREGYFALDDAAQIVWQVAKALGVAHAAGIVHRDLKPGNIFLVPQGEEELVKVLDFGVAKTGFAADETRKPAALIGTPHHKLEVDGNEATRAGTIVGTPQYMSPEQARGRKIDHRADLWSLAVIAYRMITGKLPFHGKTAAEVIVKVATADPPKPSAIAPDLRPEVDAFFARALSRNPDDRFQSARELARALRSISTVSMPTLSVPDPRLPAPSDSSWNPEASGRYTPPSGRLSDPGSTGPSERFTPAPSSRRLPPPADIDAPTRITSDAHPALCEEATLRTESTLESDAAPASSQRSSTAAQVMLEARPGEVAAPRRRAWGMLAALAAAAVGTSVWLAAGPLREAPAPEAAPGAPEPEARPSVAARADNGPLSTSAAAASAARSAAAAPEQSAEGPPDASASAPPRARTPSPDRWPSPGRWRPGQRAPAPIPPAPAPPSKPKPVDDPFVERH